MLRNPFPGPGYLHRSIYRRDDPYRSGTTDPWPSIAPGDSKPAKRVKTRILDVVEKLGDTVAILPLDPRSDLSRFRCFMLAPNGTPIQDYILSLHIGFPVEVLLPPKICFESKVWHPKVNIETGMICGTDSVPWLTGLDTTLASIQSLLTTRVSSEDWGAMLF